LGACGVQVNIAKPPGGFQVRISPAVQAHLREVTGQFDDFEWRWASVVDRLKQTAHVEGVAIDGHAGQRGGVFMMDDWRIKVAWHVLGDTVTVMRADF
jgi:hypothetical protein